MSAVPGHSQASSHRSPQGEGCLISTAAVRNLLLAGGLHHPVDACAPSIVQTLQAQGIETDVEEDIEAGCQRLAQGHYQLLTVSALRWPMPEAKYDPHRARWALTISQQARSAIEQFLRGGGGLLAMHAAAISFDDWPQWADIVGSRWVWGQSGHAPYGDIEVRFDADDSQALGTGLPSFQCQDEVYENMTVAPDVQPLAQARNLTGSAGHPGAWAPVWWTRRWHGARIVYDALGHDAQSLDHPVHRQLLAQSVAWVLGQDTRLLPAPGA
jgi:type 1 glutamine amidotransferase